MRLRISVSLAEFPILKKWPAHSCFPYREFGLRTRRSEKTSYLNILCVAVLLVQSCHVYSLDQKFMMLRLTRVGLRTWLLIAEPVLKPCQERGILCERRRVLTSVCRTRNLQFCFEGCPPLVQFLTRPYTPSFVNQVVPSNLILHVKV